MAKVNEPNRPHEENASSAEAPKVEVPGVKAPVSAPQVEMVDTDQLDIDPRFDMHGEDADLSDLAESASEVGLLEPLLAEKCADGKGRVISGSRRLRFAVKNDWKQVRVQWITFENELQAEAAAIDANFVRKELSEGRKFVALARRKKIHEQLHPQTKHGGARGGSDRQNGDLKKKAERFTRVMAKEMGMSERTVQRAIKVGEKASPELVRALDAKALKLTDAEKIAALPPAEQPAEIERRRTEKKDRKPPGGAVGDDDIEAQAEELLVVARRLEKSLTSATAAAALGDPPKVRRCRALVSEAAEHVTRCGVILVNAHAEK